MLNAIYHYYEISGEINSLYLLHTILLLCFYLVSITKKKKKKKNQISFMNYIRVNFNNLITTHSS
jgi:hypothetical protein